MTDTDRENAHEERPIRSVETIGEQGDRTTRLRVFCAEHKSAMALETCAKCAHCASLPAEPAESDAHIACVITEERRIEIEHHRHGPDLAEAAVRTLVGEVMSRHVLAVRRDVRMGTIAGILAEHDAPAVSVVTEDGLVVGIVSRSDALAARGDETAGDKMTPRVYTISESARLAHAVALMTTEDVRQIPVLADDGELVGMLTDRDALRWLAEGLGYSPEAGRKPTPPTEGAAPNPAPASGLAMSTLRRRLRADHTLLRGHLARVDEAAARIRNGETTALGDLGNAVRQLATALRVHLAAEEKQLAPLLGPSEPRGAKMMKAMRSDHAHQRTALLAVAEDIVLGARPAVELADAASALAETLRADMDHEEQNLLRE